MISPDAIQYFLATRHKVSDDVVMPTHAGVERKTNPNELSHLSPP